MAQYLSQTRIEGPIWLSSDEISFLRVQIADIEHQINLIEQQPSSPELERQKDTKLGELSSLRNILSPVRRIPLEILSHIFEIHCPMSSKLNPGFPELRDVVQYTTVLSKVCVAWKDAVAATPKLLSRIFISTHVMIRAKSAFRAQASWIEQWLPRSRGVPLNLYLQLYGDLSDLNKSIAIRATKLVEKLIPFRTQIRSLNLECSLTIILPIFRLPSSSFPLLEELRLDIANNDPHVVRSSEAFSGASHLRRLGIVEHPTTSVLKLLALPFEQLTVLRIDVPEDDDDDPNPAIYFDALRQCGENLVDLSLRLSCDFTFSTLKSDRLFLPRLKILSISCSRKGNKDISLLSLFTLPLLEDLTLYLPNHYGEYHGDLGAEFAAFQERSAVILTSLNVVNMFDNENVDNVIGLLAVLPTLMLLGIRDYEPHSVDRLFQGLLFTEASPILLPKLINLEVHYWSYRNYPSNLTPMVLSRWWPGVDEPERNGVSRLQKISLKGNYHTDISQLQGLSGLEINWERVS